MGESGEPFPNQILFDHEAALVRHGHEYDPRAFGVDYTHVDVLPEPIPAKAYQENGLGDFVTVEIASRLPWELRQSYDDEAIRKTPLLRHVYERLLEFDLTPEQLARLHGPIGLYIGSKTPSEIAISILAELTAIKNGVPTTMLIPHAASPAAPGDTVCAVDSGAV